MTEVPKTPRPPKTGPFTRLLVADRGAGAMRIIKSARAMGLTCVAVYTRADFDSPHVAFADEAICIGDDNYQAVDRLVQAARDSGAQAVHPGTGPLAESAAFAKACAKAKLIFVGASAETLAQVGDKAVTRRVLTAAKVSCLPGYDGADQSLETLSQEAERIGYPVMIKPACGTEGRAMRLVEGAYALELALKDAQDAAVAQVGSKEVVLEAAPDEPRHIEVALLADAQGGLVHLGERDCSIQRRNQALIAEAPAPGLKPKQRDKILETALLAARTVGFVGVGSVEFLLDGEGKAHVLEITSGLQFSARATEAVCGLDLVQEQLRIAQGDPLGREQGDIRFDGFGIAARLAAEDAGDAFQPQAGRLVLWQAGEGVQAEIGVTSGQAISPLYDPVLALYAAQGHSREAARLRLRWAMQQTLALGLATTRDLLVEILSHEAFKTAALNTGFLREHFPRPSAGPLTTAEIAVAAALFYWREADAAAQSVPEVPEELLSWSNQGVLLRRMRLRATLGGFDRAMAGRDGVLTARLEDRGGQVRVFIGEMLHVVTRSASGQVLLDGVPQALRAQMFEGAQLHLATETRVLSLMLEPVRRNLRATQAQGEILAPLHGRLKGLQRREGDLVQEGDLLMVIEAMKISHQIRAATTGRIVALPVIAGDQVSRGDLLVRIEATESALEVTAEPV